MFKYICVLHNKRERENMNFRSSNGANPGKARVTIQYMGGFGERKGKGGNEEITF